MSGKKRWFQQRDVDIKYIPLFHKKFEIMSQLASLTQEELKKKQLEQLEIVLDSFPVDEKAGKIFGLWSRYWKKYESDGKTYYYFLKNADYIDREMFYPILNGILPHPKNTKKNDLSMKDFFEKKIFPEDK